MPLRSFFSSTLSIGALLVSLPAAALPAKRLASPPEDMLSGKLAPPRPEAAGLSSHSALLPVHFDHQAGGPRRFEATFPVDASERFSVFLLAPRGGWEASVQPPLAHGLGRLSQAGATASTGELALGEQRVSGEIYAFDHPTNGEWRIAVETAEPANKDAAGKPDGFLLVSFDSPLRLYTHLASYDLVAGKTVGLVAYMHDAQADAPGRMPRPLAGAIEKAVMQLTTPSGQAVSIPMFDDGRHQDGEAGDGVFGGLLAKAAAGSYRAQVAAMGVSPEGKAFLRTSEHFFPVVKPALRLGREVTAEAVGPDLRFDLTIARLRRAEAVTVGAEVWGTRAGVRVPVAWIGGMIEPEEQGGKLVLPLVLDGRWLERAAATAPFELRQVMVKDRQVHIPIASFGRLAVDTLSLPAPRAEKATGITAEMLQGPRPSELDRAADKAFEGGPKLFLVHGYCSADVWSSQQASFANSAVFLDLNQNRTHDQFARLIRDRGAVWDSFGVVAHSQGGAATTHLYTYYFSGLDSAVGNRLIQSVGTPYQGTALAGLLALVGDIFGAGCGTNFDLTYDGAALWLSGIPSWARAEVNYFTTSFTDSFFSYDYCQIASDLVLSNPEDGVVEQSRGQLPGAVNRGHKTGWCHTSGMRDPAQTTDGVRNAEMSANAAR